MSKTLTTLLAVLLWVTGAVAQNDKLFDTANGLSSSMVTDVFQNHEGRILIATRNGLNVYDGYNFRVVDKSSPLGQGLDGNYFNSLCENKDGLLFVATNTGVFSFDGRRFTRYVIYGYKRRDMCTYVRHLSLCHDGTVLASTSGFGIQQIRPGGKDAVCRRIGGALGRYDYVVCTMEDSNRRLWVVTENGDLVCRLNDGKVMTAFIGLGGVNVTCVCEDARGNVYVGSNGQGVYALRRGMMAFERIPGIQPSTGVSCLSMTRGHTLLVGCDGSGIIAYDTMTGVVTPNPFFSNLVNLEHGKVFSIIEDRHGNIWVAMFQKGVYMQPPLAYGFGYQGPRLGSRNSIGDFCVNSVLLSREGNMWVGTDKGGLYELDRNGRQLLHLNSPQTVMSLTEDAAGRIWVGAYTAGCGYVEDGRYHEFNFGNRGHLCVFDVKFDRDGTMWIATMGQGLVRRDAGGTTTVYRAGRSAFYNRKLNSLPNDFISSLVVSPDGRRVYVATSIGMACYDKVRKSWTSEFGINCLKEKEMISCAFVDSKERLWYGCNKGLWMRDGKSGKEKFFNADNGLPSGDVSFVTEDRAGHIWVGTSHGLSRLGKGKPVNYFADNGLQGNEFSSRAVSRNAEATLFIMGGTGGVSWFNPLVVRQPKWTAEVMVTGVESNDNDVLDDDSLVFAHDDNSITFFLSTNTYNDVEQITYAYKLDDDKWKTLPQGSNQLMFTRLPSGKHRLLVKASRNGQETPVREYVVRVRTAWYATVWAKLAYLLLFALFVWLVREDYRHKQHVRNLIGQIKDIKKFVVPINEDVATQTPDDKLIERVMKYINDNLTDSDLSVEKIADAVGISRVHLHRKMKELTGQTPHALIKRLRLRQAAKLLEDPKQSISDVLYTCGFSNSASFSTMFKGEYGVSPRDYQRGKRREDKGA